MPFFSVIVPVFNRESELRATVIQILQQTFTDYEIIVVDDGSTDASYKSISDLASDDLRIYKKENGERGAARNFGARRARGEYLIFFDSDDLMYSQHLENVHQFIIGKAKPPVIYTAFEIKNRRGAVLRTVAVNTNRLFSKLVKDNFLGCDSVIVRSDIFRNFWFNEDRRLATMEDKELWLRLAAVHPFTYLPKVGFAMIEHRDRSLNQQSANKIEEVTEALVDALKSYPSFLKAFGYRAQLIFAREYSLVSSVWSVDGDLKKGRKYLRKALNHSLLVVFNKRFLAAVKNYLVRLIR